jgi:aminoglycoside phosphotransferase (APT) family kinase protein
MVLPRDEALEHRIAALALAHYGHTPRVLKYHSENNYVCRLAFDGAIPDRVIKVGVRLAASVRQEAEAMRRLHAAGLEVPEVEFSDDDNPGFGHTFFVMPHLGDIDLGAACAARLDWAEAACRRTGQFLARLQSLPLEILDGLPPQHYSSFNTEYAGSRWPELRDLPHPNRPGQSLLAVVREIVDLDLAEPGQVVAHESFIPGQVITDGNATFGVTDWETIRSGRPLQDPSVFAAGLRAWYGGELRYFDALVAGWTGGRRLTADEQRRCTAWECLRLFWWAEYGLRSNRPELADPLLAELLVAGRTL